MNVKNYPIFRKDFGILIKMVIAALVVQAAIVVLFPSIALMIGARGGSMDEWFPQVQLSIGVLIGLIAAAYWYAEERAGNNLVFLFRLPISVRQIWKEKIAAAFIVLAILFVIQVIWSIAVYSIDKKFANLYGLVYVLFLLGTSFVAYGVGLPLSRYLKQTISVVLLGLVAVSIVIYGLWIAGTVLQRIFSQTAFFTGRDIILIHNRDAFLLFLGWMVLICLLYGLGAYRIFTRNRLRTRFTFLSSIYFVQNRLYAFLIFVFLFAIILRCLIPDLNYDPIRLHLLAVFLLFSSLLGVITYANEEKHGLRNLLYYHPVSLSYLFWVRWLSGLFLAIVPAVCFTFYLLTKPDLKAVWDSGLGGLWFSFHLFLLGLIPYACGTFFTHAIRNTLYAWFESILATAGIVYLYYYIYTIPKLSVGVFNSYYTVVDFGSFKFTHFCWLTVMLLVGFSLAGWRAATDRELLTRGTVYRQVYVWRIYVFMFVLFAVVLKTGWKDLFFLITGIDIGMG